MHSSDHSPIIEKNQRAGRQKTRRAITSAAGERVIEKVEIKTGDEISLMWTGSIPFVSL